MKHAKPSRAWRPVRAHRTPRSAHGVWVALLFNICLLLLPAAAAGGFYVMARDQLYAYQYSEAGARAVSNRLERLLGGLIVLDFDRQRQWDNLVAMELMNEDVAAARGFLLSARRMLSSRDAGQLDRRIQGDADDAAIELAALEMLTPGTRARYEATVPLLSRRAATVSTQTRDPARDVVLGDQDDFELLVRATLAEGGSDVFNLTLTGMGLGLAGELTPRQRAGASALIDASRRRNYPADFAEEMRALLASALPSVAFREQALAAAEGGDAGAYANAAATFQAVQNPERMAAVQTALDEIGAMSDAASPVGAAWLIAHAHAVRDLPRLRLIAQASGDRAVAAAKRLPRETELASVAHGDLQITRDLAAAIALGALAFAGLLFGVALVVFQAAQRAWVRVQDDIDGGELIESFGGAWRSL